MRSVLRAGGVWINLGPLLYHGARDGPRLTAEEVLAFVQRCGFNMMDTSFLETSYGQDERSMCRTEYLSLFFVARLR